MDALDKYIKKLRKLRIDRAHGDAPHKRILMLSVLQTFRNRLFISSEIGITPELVALFKSNWNALVTTKHEPLFALPFFHMRSEGFWKLIPNTGFTSFLKHIKQIRAFSTLNAAVAGAVIDTDLYELMALPDTNELLQQFIITEFFKPKESTYRYNYNPLPDIFDDISNKILCEPPVEYKAEIKKLIEDKEEEEIFIRSSVFKREIPRIYNNTCCISGTRIDAAIDVSMVDACHIVPFAESHDDTITNGICLCPNLHRAFDRGLITIDEDYRVVVSDKFMEKSEGYTIRVFAGSKIGLPNNFDYRPSIININNHKKKIFITTTHILRHTSFNSDKH